VLLFPANLKERRCVGEILIADISESSMSCLPAARIQLRVFYLSVARRRSLSMHLTDTERRANEDMDVETPDISMHAVNVQRL